MFQLLLPKHHRKAPHVTGLSARLFSLVVGAFQKDFFCSKVTVSSNGQSSVKHKRKLPNNNRVSDLDCLWLCATDHEVNPKWIGMKEENELTFWN